MNVHFGAAKVIIGSFVNPEIGKLDEEGEKYKKELQNILRTEPFKKELTKMPDGTNILFTRESSRRLNYTVIFPKETEVIRSITTGYLTKDTLSSIFQIVFQTLQNYNFADKNYRYNDKVSIEERPEITCINYEVDEENRTINLKK